MTQHRAICHGFVLMPDHLHVLLQFSEQNQLSSFLQQWKQKSSYYSHKVIHEHFPSLLQTNTNSEPFWQRKYYDFPIEGKAKYLEKLQYIHLNPVRAGLVDKPADWKWSSARWYESGIFKGIEITAMDSLS